jgi:O-antigen/teichoic acid export membrane protein
MYLGALDFQKDSFKATAVGATGNIVLNIAFIPLIGIDGAALATLITLALNSALSGLYLSKVMKIKIDYSSMRNILVAAGIMGIFVLAYRMLLNTSSILTIMIPVFLGAIVYFILIVKMDQNIKNEIKKIVFHANLPWPHWL